MTPDPSPPYHPARSPGGVVHTYLAYDPKNFPSPTAPPPDFNSAAFEHMLAYGSMRGLTPEELARAVRVDPSMFPGLGPSLDALIRMLEERKSKILSRYETGDAARQARKAVERAAEEAEPPKKLRDAFDRAVRQGQIHELERLYYQHGDDRSAFAGSLTGLIHAMGTQYQVEQLAGKYPFTGRETLTPERAVEVKEELESIDTLLEQLREAMRNAQIGIIDLEELSEFAPEGDMERLNRFMQQIEEYVRQEAERQGLETTRRGFELTPKAMRLFQARLLDEIFSELEAARSGRHTGPVFGEGPVELPRTKPYEFGDSATGMDVVQTVVNAAAGAGERWSAGAKQRESEAARQRRGEPGVDRISSTGAGSPPSSLGLAVSASPRLRVSLSDVEIHRTRNAPKCATAVVMDMSGSMRNDGQYINCKRMALALDGLIRREYPGDFLSFIEMYTFAKPRRAGELPALMPKPVTIRQPVVRLKVDMSDPRVSEIQIPPHFTNIQHGLKLARRFLSVQDTPNRQIILITDGLPTAHFEDSTLLLLYPPDPRTEEATMREAGACAKQNITINLFLLPSWWQSSEDVRFAHRLAEQTRGRVFFPGGRDLDRYVVWDYVKQRRRVIG